MSGLNEIEKLNHQSVMIELQKTQLQIVELKNLFLQTNFQKNIPEYVTLKMAAELKGVTSYENLQKKTWQQPCCGTNAIRVNGRKAWKRQDVIEWLAVTDSSLESYARKMNVDISRHFKNGKNI